ncbi:glucan endo-1,3-beta-glucosidase 3-like [Andrographis paniculata]|uniref:glucan endo-1,3-beta-glucosidase 3-like n=1 Tax=Andrographis paniculata TaxID=175694 RepID=UPI0021E829A3|nr:glucan endo-1,3-beta-glucosidase 3-like [Andrographis paniculata]
MSRLSTPKHPRFSVVTYIYELYNEDVKPGTVSGKNWGLFDVDGTAVYALHLTDSGTVLASDTANETYCVARDGADKRMLHVALDWACGPGKVDCSLLMQGKPCYERDSILGHASYAFNAYYQRMAMGDGTCDFNSVAAISTTNPSLFRIITISGNKYTVPLRMTRRLASRSAHSVLFEFSDMLDAPDFDKTRRIL